VLYELRVENLLLIERAQLTLADGLNVLTGETGAGKTVLAHALDLLLGGRARPGIVRPGAGEAYVEGVFSLAPRLAAERGERLPADAQEVVLARRVGADGRTRAYLNGRSATVAELRELGEHLIAFYGQHEHRRLTLAAAQLQILDDFCGPRQLARLRGCAQAYAAVRELEGELQRMRELLAAGERELDLLEHELAEIDRAAPREGEHEQLLAARRRLRRVEDLRLAAGLGAEALAPELSELPGAAQLAADAAARLEGVEGVDEQLDPLVQRAHTLAIETADLAGELREYGRRLEGEDGSLQEVEERLQLLEHLLRKHGGTIAAVLAHAEQARSRRELLTDADATSAALTERLRVARERLDRCVAELRAARAAAAPLLRDAVAEQLAALAMPDAVFAIALHEREAGPHGADAVEFQVAPNPGVPAGPLREIASGGELSRVMLALATAARSAGSERAVGKGPGSEDGAKEHASPKERGSSTDADAEVALVFDEIDAGIGGQTARAVGERLRDLAKTRQVICITHLPQIASLAARHFTVVKDTAAEPTRTRVVRLDERETVAELVRMLGAADDDTAARRHAMQLRKAA
jgi:DNA repair protein RecN (Recombination protein N)